MFIMAQQHMQAAAYQPLPFAVEQQAGMYQMGMLTATYRPQFTNPFIIIGLALGAIVVDIALLFAILSTGWIVYVLIFIPFIVVIYAIRGLMNCNVRVYTFANGFLRAKGKAIDVIRYDAVTQVFFISRKGRYGTVSYTLTVVRNDGATFKFTGLLRNIVSLGSAVQSEIVRRHTPFALDAFNRGRILPFGPLSISQQGISNGRATLPWNAIQPITSRKGYIVVKQINQRSNFARVKVSQIPNLPVFFNVVNYVRGGV
jgi:hypothetical protein